MNLILSYGQNPRINKVSRRTIICLLESSDSRNHFLCDEINRRYLMDTGQRYNKVLNTSVAQAAAIFNRVLRAHTAGSQIKRADGGLFDFVKRPAHLFTVSPEHRQLSAHRFGILKRIEVTSVGILGYQAQRLFLTRSADHDGRV